MIIVKKVVPWSDSEVNNGTLLDVTQPCIVGKIIWQQQAVQRTQHTAIYKRERPLRTSNFYCLPTYLCPIHYVVLSTYVLCLIFLIYLPTQKLDIIYGHSQRYQFKWIQLIFQWRIWKQTKKLLDYIYTRKFLFSWLGVSSTGCCKPSSRMEI